jgi:hypothetical protein
MEDRMNVILDLDNTIIVALEEQERDLLSMRFQGQFEYHDILSYGMRIFARPGLQPFLDYLFANFNVSVYTAAEQEYALFIINHFLLMGEHKGHRKVHYMFWRYHVDMGMKRYNGMKDLRLLFNVFNVPNFYPCNTVIIDDLIDVYEANPDNTIPIDAFKIVSSSTNLALPKSVDDKELERVKTVLDKLNNRFKNSYNPRLIRMKYCPA